MGLTVVRPCSCPASGNVALSLGVVRYGTYPFLRLTQLCEEFSLASSQLVGELSISTPLDRSAGIEVLAYRDESVNREKGRFGLIEPFLSTKTESHGTYVPLQGRVVSTFRELDSRDSRKT